MDAGKRFAGGTTEIGSGCPAQKEMLSLPWVGNKS